MKMMMMKLETRISIIIVVITTVIHIARLTLTFCKQTDIIRGTWIDDWYEYIFNISTIMSYVWL